MVGERNTRHSSSSSSSSAAYEPLLVKDESDASSDTLRSPTITEANTSGLGKDFESDDVNIGSRAKGQSEQLSSSSRRQAQWLTVLVLITFCLTLFNAILLIFPNSRPASSWQDNVNDEPIPTPDAYIGLRKMLRLEGWKESLKPFYNFPFEVALMDKTRPNDVIPNFRAIAHVNKTVIVPDNRHVVISNHTSTILQFYTLEFGFERCQITFSLPTNRSLSPRTPRPGAETNTIEIYLLNNPNSRTSISDAVLPLSESLTHASRPERIKLLGGLVMPHAARDETGGDWEGRTGSFECKERTIQTVELSCSGNCDVDLWMDKYDEGPIIGPRMMQHPTL